MGTPGLTTLLPILFLVLLPGPLAAFPDHGFSTTHQEDDMGAGHAVYSYEPPQIPEEPPEEEDMGDGHAGYNYNPPSNSYVPPEPEGLVWAEYRKKWAVKDDYAGLDFGQDEMAKKHAVEGVYYVLLPDGRKQTVSYHVDKDSGYVATVSYEQGPVPHPIYEPPSPPSHLYGTPEPPVTPTDLYTPPTSHSDDTLPTHEPSEHPAIDLRTDFGH